MSLLGAYSPFTESGEMKHVQAAFQIIGSMNHVLKLLAYFHRVPKLDTLIRCLKLVGINLGPTA